MMKLIQELKEVLPIEDDKPKIHCTIFEDNNSCIVLVKFPKMRPRIKHICLKYHHFRSKVKQSVITVNYIDTLNQTANIFTRTLTEPQFL